MSFTARFSTLLLPRDIPNSRTTRDREKEREMTINATATHRDIYLFAASLYNLLRFHEEAAHKSRETPRDQENGRTRN